jgi:hypothetical protein
MGVPDVNEAEDVGRSMRRRLDELAETQHWVHHVGDLDSGEVLTTPLDRPVMPLSRAERLSRLGHVFDDTSIFSGPRYRLTPRAPYQAVPEASFSVSGNPSGPFVGLISYSSTHDEVVWRPPRDATGPLLGLLRASFAESPRGRSVLSILLSGQARSGAVGHVLIRESQAGASIRIPITDAFASHTVDLTFIPRAGELSDVIMSLEDGIEFLTFHSISFAVQRPVVASP